MINMKRVDYSNKEFQTIAYLTKGNHEPSVDRNWTRIVYVMISVNCFDSRRLLAETKSPSKLFECATTTRRQHANPTQTRVQLTGDPKL